MSTHPKSPLSWKEQVCRTIQETWIPDAERNAHSALHRKNFYSPELVPVAEATGWAQFVELTTQRLRPGEWIFRGHSDSTWRLETSLERAVLRHVDDGPNCAARESYPTRHPNDFERSLIEEAQRFARSHGENLPEPNETVEWLSILQHYGAPTRLLDWTRSPYVALYFALRDESVSNRESAVWAIHSGWLKGMLDEQNTSALRLPGYVDDIIRKRKNVRLIVCPPTRLHPRLEAQQGLFLCDLSNEETFDITLLKMIVQSVAPPVLPDKPRIVKVVVIARNRDHFLSKLGRMNINASSLFPGDDFARPLQEKIRDLVDALHESIGWTLSR